MFGPIAFAPSAADTAYAVGFDNSLWRTDDAGKTWKKVPEQAFRVRPVAIRTGCRPVMTGVHCLREQNEEDVWMGLRTRKVLSLRSRS